MMVTSRMKSVLRWRPPMVPLRWLYAALGAFLAGLAIVAARTLPSSVVAVAVVTLCAIAGSVVGRKEDWLRLSATTDPLTAVANRRHFDARLVEEVSLARRQRVPLAVLFVDVDNLKALNDEFGHAAGDASLRLVGETLRRTCRSRDVAARWGGDEFVVLCAWTTSVEALVLANRIRATLARLAAEREIAPAPTVSIGVAELARVESPTPDLLLCAADDALYLAKLRGRNRVEVAGQGKHRRHCPELSRLKTRPFRVTPVDMEAPRIDPRPGRGERI
jgi:diguanylate cyclase (GGDEF)-like protein